MTMQAAVVGGVSNASLGHGWVRGGYRGRTCSVILAQKLPCAQRVLKDGSAISLSVASKDGFV